MSNVVENTNKLLDFIGNKFQNEELNNESLVQIIELCGSYLNLQTISNYAKNNKLSYNGAKHYRHKIKLFGQKFIIDNE